MGAFTISEALRRRRLMRLAKCWSSPQVVLHGFVRRDFPAEYARIDIGSYYADDTAFRSATRLDYRR